MSTSQSKKVDRSFSTASSLLRFLPLGGLALLIRLLLAPWFCHETDMGLWKFWAERLSALGPSSFYGEVWSDYLPGYLYVLWALGAIQDAIRLDHVNWLFKLPSIIADVLTAWLIWRWACPGPKSVCEKRFPSRDRERAVTPGRGKPLPHGRGSDSGVLSQIPSTKRLWVPALYLFNPAVLINSTLWGQVDSFHALFVVGGLWLLCRRRLEWSAVVLGFALAIKPHTVVILPLAGLYALVNRFAWYRVIGGAAIVVAVFTAAFLPFNGWSVGTLPGFVQARITTTMDQYQYASVNALNLWYVLGLNFKSDIAPLVGSLTPQMTGTLLLALCYVMALAFAWRRRRDGEQALWQAASVVCLATFLVITRAHERHLFPYFPMAMMVAAFRPAALVPYTVLSVTYTLNLVYAWRWIAMYPDGGFCGPVTGITISIVSIAMLPVVFLAQSERGGRWFERIRSRAALRSESVLPDDSAWIERRTPALLGLIVLVAMTSRVIRLDTPPVRYYDEVYHAYTAGEFAKGNADAWLWNKRAPQEDCAYEWSHPPLAKLFMAASIRLFGQHAWAWRLPAALMGTICALLIFLIARALFGRNSIALLATAFYAFDSLPLFASRIGMNDIYCVTFILAAVLAALRRRCFLAAVAAGAALACKWTGLFALPLLGVIHLLRADREKRWRLAHLATVLAVYVLVVPAVYVASYTPFFTARHSLAQFEELQKQMWWYHTRLDAKHPFSSPAWQWPLGRAYVWCYTADVEDDGARRADVYAVGNPVIWLGGLIGIYLAIIVWIRDRDRCLLPLVLGYLVFWAPWLGSPRIMFVTHYLPALPFLYIALAWTVVYMRIGRMNTVLLLLISLLAFLAIDPFVTAWPMPSAWNPTTWR